MMRKLTPMQRAEAGIMLVTNPNVRLPLGKTIEPLLEAYDEALDAIEAALPFVVEAARISGEKIVPGCSAEDLSKNAVVAGALISLLDALTQAQRDIKK